MKNVHAKNNVFCQTGMVEWNIVTRCIVVLNRSDYIRNMMELIRDKKKKCKTYTWPDNKKRASSTKHMK